MIKRCCVSEACMQCSPGRFILTSCALLLSGCSDKLSIATVVARKAVRRVLCPPTLLELEKAGPVFMNISSLPSPHGFSFFLSTTTSTTTSSTSVRTQIPLNTVCESTARSYPLFSSRLTGCVRLSAHEEKSHPSTHLKKNPPSGYSPSSQHGFIRSDQV